MQIIPYGENVWGNIGTSLGELAGAKLAKMVGEKRKEKERSEFKEQWKPYLGEEKARFLSNLEPEERKHVMSNLESLMQLQQIQQQPQQQNILASLQGYQQQPQQQEQYNPQQEVQSALQQYFSNPTLGGGQQGLMSALSGFQQPEQQMQQMPQQQQEQGQLTPERAKLISDLFVSPHERREREKLELKKQQIASSEKANAYKETKVERKEILNEAKSAKENLARLDRMAELSRKGKLDSPIYIEFLKKTGLDIPALTSPDSQEFRKLEVDFLRDAKNIFGARVTNYEAAQFLKSIPSLSQSKEGREKVIKNLKIMNEGKLLRADALKDIIKENNGTPPLDLLEQIDDRIAPKIDKLLNDFRRGGDVGRAYNDLPSAAQFSGKTAIDEETGQKFKSDGSKWVPIK